MKSFKNFGELTSALAFDLIDHLRAHDFGDDFELIADYGKSNQSCSAYVNFSLYDDESELVADGKIRFSDHSDRHGSDVTIRIDGLISTVTDECGEYVETTMAEQDYEDSLQAAFAAAIKISDQGRAQ